jgi:hypothetical protein
VGYPIIDHGFPQPYSMDPQVCSATFGVDRHGKEGGWLSIAGEWVRLDTAEIWRLMKKVNQARELRIQWEKEHARSAASPLLLQPSSHAG